MAVVRLILTAAFMVSGGVGLTLAFVLPGITVPLLSFAVGDASAAEAAPVAWLPWMRAREVITEEILDELEALIEG